MTLENLIRALAAVPPDTKIRWGFHRPHSYRGHYSELAFEPCGPTTAGAMLACARDAVGKTFVGYKGGDFTMDGSTRCWLSDYGECTWGEGVITVDMLARILANEIPDDDERWNGARS